MLAEAFRLNQAKNPWVCQNERGRYYSRIRSRQIHKKALHTGTDRGCR